MQLVTQHPLAWSDATGDVNIPGAGVRQNGQIKAILDACATPRRVWLYSRLELELVGVMDSRLTVVLIDHLGKYTNRVREGERKREGE